MLLINISDLKYLLTYTNTSDLKYLLTYTLGIGQLLVLCPHPTHVASHTIVMHNIIIITYIIHLEFATTLYMYHEFWLVFMNHNVSSEYITGTCIHVNGRRALLGVGKTKPLVGDVKFGVIGPNEHVSHDPQRPNLNGT